MQKKEFLQYWASLTPNQPVSPRAIPYKHEGSTYTEDSIRLTGSKDFVDSVLSRLQDLLTNEASDRRLGVVYKESMDRATDTGTGSYNVYIQVHERGGEAKQANALREQLAAVPPAPEVPTLAVAGPADGLAVAESVAEVA